MIIKNSKTIKDLERLKEIFKEANNIAHNISPKILNLNEFKKYLYGNYIYDINAAIQKINRGN